MIAEQIIMVQLFHYYWSYSYKVFFLNKVPQKENTSNSSFNKFGIFFTCHGIFNVNSANANL